MAEKTVQFMEHHGEIRPHLECQFLQQNGAMAYMASSHSAVMYRGCVGGVGGGGGGWCEGTLLRWLLD